MEKNECLSRERDFPFQRSLDESNGHAERISVQKGISCHNKFDNLITSNQHLYFHTVKMLGNPTKTNSTIKNKGR